MAARLVFAFATVLLIGAVSRTTAASRADAATQCVYFENPADLWRMASAVFVGTVTSSQLTGQQGIHFDVEIGTFKVERSWKGRLPAEIKVGNERSWQIGTQYLVFAGGTPLSTTTLCDWAVPIERAKTKLEWLSKTVNVVDIYRVLLYQSYHGGFATTPNPWGAVYEAGISMPTLRDASPDWVSQFDAMPADLRRFATEKEPARAHAIDSSMVPPGTPLIPSGAKPALDQRRTIAFSPVLYTREGLDALVYYDAVCGGLCAEAGYAWLQRDSYQAPWRVARRVVRRVS